MRILGVDTATSTASVAIVEDGALVAERIVPRRMGTNGSAVSRFRSNHAENLLPLIESVLQEAAVSISEVSGLAVSLGPGSFTGLRIGLSTVKGLAYGWQIPVVGVSTLLANATRVTDYEGLICPFLDAQKKEVYTSLFRRFGGSLARLSEDAVLDVQQVIELVRTHDAPCLFIGDGTSTYEKLLQQSLASGVYFRGEDFSPSVAAAVARLGEEHCRSSDCAGLLSLAPVYLRSSEAEVKRKICSN